MTDEKEKMEEFMRNSPPPKEELTNKEKKGVVFEDPRQGDSRHYPTKGEGESMEELEKMTSPEVEERKKKMGEPTEELIADEQKLGETNHLRQGESSLKGMSKAEDSPVNDKQEPKLGDVVERVEVSVDDLPIDLPEPRDLTPTEQLAHTQVAYQALLEDFEKVSRELAELKEVPGDAIQVASLQGQVSDLQDEKLTLLETVRLKQQVIDDLQAKPAVPADVKTLQSQVAELEEGNRILKRRLQGTV